MFKFAGWLTYQDMPRRGDRVKATFVIGLFPPTIRITIHDPAYSTEHTLINSRFNFQSRDSLVDLLARDAWTTDWIDMLDGDLHLIVPTITGVTRTLGVTLYASWWPAFCIIDFRQGDDYCQIATRPRTTFQTRWTRTDVVPEWPPADVNQRDDSPDAPESPEADVLPVIHRPAPADDEPDYPLVIDFENVKNPSKTLNSES